MGGYDMVTADMRALLIDGELPATNPSSSDGGVRADGPVAPNVGLPPPTGTHGLGDRCQPGKHPAAPTRDALPEPVRKLILSRLQVSQRFFRAHIDCGWVLGEDPVYSWGDWFASRTPRDPTWMWVTADVVWTCTSLRADRDPSYWRDGPSGNPQCDPLGPQRMTDNVLIGEITYLNPTAGTASSTTAVHIEADPDLSVVTADSSLVPGRRQSFALRYSATHTDTRDLREPLPTAWAIRYEGYEAPGLDTHLQVWIGASATPLRSDLRFMPEHRTLLALDRLPYTTYAWDEDENVVESGGEVPWPGNREVPPAWVSPNLLPLMTQEVSIDQLWPLPGESGWMLLVLPHSSGWADPCDSSGPPIDQLQGWMQIRRTNPEKRGHAAVRPGAVLANASCFPDQVLPDLAVNYDYVSGDGPALPDREEAP
jgi:hypothetical protein